MVGVDQVSQAELLSASTYLKHAANLVFALLHVLLYRLPIVSFHFLAVLLFGSSYLVFTWLYGELSGTWRYKLKWYQPRGLVSYALMPFVLLLCFYLWYLVARLREWLGHRCRHLLAAAELR